MLAVVLIPSQIPLGRGRMLTTILTNMSGGVYGGTCLMLAVKGRGASLCLSVPG
jgi:hypothetical protein